MSTAALRILILDDSADDAKLMERAGAQAAAGRASPGPSPQRPPMPASAPS